MIDDIQLIQGLETMEGSILNVRVSAEEIRTYDFSKIELDFSKEMEYSLIKRFIDNNNKLPQFNTKYGLKKWLPHFEEI